MLTLCKKRTRKSKPECCPVDQSGYFPGGSDGCCQSGMKGVNINISTALRQGMRYKCVITFMDFVNDVCSLSKDSSTWLFLVDQILTELLHQL